MPTSRQELITLQKRLVEELKETIYEHVGRDDPVLDRYYRDYQAEFKQGFERPASRSEVLLQLSRANVAFFGDYHTLRSSQTAVLDVLDTLRVSYGKELCVCVEMLRASDNAHAQDFIAERFDAAEFRRRVHWTRSWNFPWASWGRFFEFARSPGVRAFGVNVEADQRADGLAFRDEFAADLIAALTQLYPHRLVAVVYGDLHTAENHMPAAVQRRLDAHGAKRRMIRVYQNSETVHWKLVERMQERVVDYVKLKRDVYCMMNATPLAKFQSFLNWQHHASEIVFEGDVAGDADAMEEVLIEQVRGFIRTICGFLDIKLEQPDNFELYTTRDMDFLADMVTSGVYSQAEMDALKDYIAMTDSAFFERSRVLYVGNFSAANVAETAARFVLSELRPDANNAVDARDEFYGRCMVEALAFFGSKIIDYRRKPRDDEAWRTVLKKFGKRRKLGDVQRKDVSTARAYLKHREYENRVLKTGDYARAPRGLYGLPTPLHVSLTRALGRSLGEMAFAAVSEERLGRQIIREAMADDVRKADQCRNRYFQILRLCTGTKNATEEE